eukprot:scaffold8120_cov239-Pinguiococcus_pyrenoidosus.AAC.5
MNGIRKEVKAVCGAHQQPWYVLYLWVRRLWRGQIRLSTPTSQLFWTSQVLSPSHRGEMGPSVLVCAALGVICVRECVSSFAALGSHALVLAIL